MCFQQAHTLQTTSIKERQPHRERKPIVNVQEGVEGFQNCTTVAPGQASGAEGSANGMNGTLTSLYNSPTPANPASSHQSEPSTSGRGNPPEGAPPAPPPPCHAHFKRKIVHTWTLSPPLSSLGGIFSLN